MFMGNKLHSGFPFILIVNSSARRALCVHHEFDAAQEEQVTLKSRKNSVTAMAEQEKQPHPPRKTLHHI